MPIVTESAPKRRVSPWWALLLAVPALVLGALAAPVVRPVFSVGPRYIGIYCGRVTGLSFLRQGFNRGDDVPIGYHARCLRLGNWYYQIAWWPRR